MMKLRLSFDSTTLYRPVDVVAALPYGWQMAAAPYKTIWALHCVMGNGELFFDKLGVADLVERYGVAVIAPSLGNAYFVNSPYERQADFLRLELRDAMRNVLPLSGESSDNFLIGISMGAFGAVTWALQCPWFGAVAAISGTFGNLAPLDQRVMKSRALRAIYMTFNGIQRQFLLDEHGNANPEHDVARLMAEAQHPLPRMELFCGEQDYLSLNQHIAFADLCEKHSCQVRSHCELGGPDQEFWRKILPPAFDALLN